MRIGFLCMEGIFSQRPLEALIADGHEICFVMRPVGGMETRKQPILRRIRSIDAAIAKIKQKVYGDDRINMDPFILANQSHIPAYLVGNASTPEVQDLIASYKPDLLVVAFFNQLLKPSILKIPKYGAINLHPSMLPEYRGPAPLFWTFYDGCEETGLTLHRIAPGEDDGDILLQERIPLPIGIRGEELLDDLAERAARLASMGVAGLARGTLLGTSQNEEKATRAPRATPESMRIDPMWPASRVFRFVRGVGRWNPLTLYCGDTAVRVVDAQEYSDETAIPGESMRLGGLLWLQCNPGVVVLEVV